jgi:hypothetical protein
MSVGPSIGDILSERVALKVKCIDRMYLNAYMSGLQYERGAVSYFRNHRGHDFLVRIAVRIGQPDRNNSFVRLSI